MEKTAVFTKEIGAEISMYNANTWATNFRTANPDKVWAQYASIENLSELLNQEGTTGISIVYGLNDNGQEVFLFKGVNGTSYINAPTVKYSAIAEAANISYGCEGKCITDLWLPVN